MTNHSPTLDASIAAYNQGYSKGAEDMRERAGLIVDATVFKLVAVPPNERSRFMEETTKWIDNHAKAIRALPLFKEGLKND